MSLFKICKASKPKVGLKIPWLKLMMRISVFFSNMAVRARRFYKTNGGHHVLVMLVLSLVLPKQYPVTCCILHCMHTRKGFAPYTCHFGFLHVTFLLRGPRTLMLKVYISIFEFAPHELLPIRSYSNRRRWL